MTKNAVSAQFFPSGKNAETANYQKEQMSVQRVFPFTHLAHSFQNGWVDLSLILLYMTDRNLSTKKRFPKREFHFLSRKKVISEIP
jgi:hypothetical protein